MIKKVKTIGELYEEVKGYDLVITNDAPLATALNKLVDKPRLDYLAMTPKQIASKFAQLYYDKLYEKYEVVLNISKQEKKPVRFIHQAIEKIYEVWMYNAKLDFVGQFISEEEESLLKYIRKFDTIETAMENFNEDFYRDKKLAVIGEELFSLLDLEVLPRRSYPAAKVNVFKEGEFNISETYIFPSTEQLVDQTVNLIDNENADETAIVLNTESDYLNILKARFKDAGIKMEIKYYLKDDISIRSFISFVELSLRINELKVKEFISIAGEFGVTIDSNFSQYDMISYIAYVNENKALQSLFSISEKVGKNTYTELLNQLEKRFQFKVNDEFLEVLELLDLNDKVVSEGNLLDLRYFLKEFDIEMDSEKSGVLFVNALNAAFVDRQQVFFIGLDNSWMKLFPDKDYLNKEDEEKKNLERFQILIQQGSQRFYFVQNVIDYREVIPCYYFKMLTLKDTGRFSNDFFKPVLINSQRIQEEYKGKTVNLPIETPEIIKEISPTSFNRFFKCPKYYSFSKLLPAEELPVFRKGNLLHNFAELYFNHPEFAKKNFKKILELMVKQMSLFFNNVNEEFLKSDLQIGMETIIKFLDDMNFPKVKLETPQVPEENLLMQNFNKEKIFLNTEKRLLHKAGPKISGKIDLQVVNTIVDYKSSKTRKTESEVTLQSNLDYIQLFELTEFDFQAAAYIAALRDSFEEINFIYNYLFANYKNHVNPDSKEDVNLTIIKYIPSTFFEYICSQKVFEELTSDIKNGLPINKLGYKNYKLILNNLISAPGDFFNKELLADKFTEVVNNKLEEMGLNYFNLDCKSQESLNKKLSYSANAIYNIRIGYKRAFLFKDDVDKFTELIKEKLEEINKYTNDVFPFEPIFGSREICKGCEYLNSCIGNKLWN